MQIALKEKEKVFSYCMSFCTKLHTQLPGLKIYSDEQGKQADEQRFIATKKGKSLQMSRD